MKAKPACQERARVSAKPTLIERAYPEEKPVRKERAEVLKDPKRQERENARTFAGPGKREPPEGLCRGLPSPCPPPGSGGRLGAVTAKLSSHIWDSLSRRVMTTAKEDLKEPFPLLEKGRRFTTQKIKQPRHSYFKLPMSGKELTTLRDMAAAEGMTCEEFARHAILRAIRVK